MVGLILLFFFSPNEAYNRSWKVWGNRFLPKGEIPIPNSISSKMARLPHLDLRSHLVLSHCCVVMRLATEENISTSKKGTVDRAQERRP